MDWKPLAIVIAIALISLALIGSPATWLTLTIAGLAMGMILFLAASGLTLVFGLMDVLNFGHGIFIAIGAFVASTLLGYLYAAGAGGGFWSDAVILLVAAIASMVVAGIAGWCFERLIVKTVYGDHLKQILVTTGGLIIGIELNKVIWGSAQRSLNLPESWRGSLSIAGVSAEKYRLAAIVLGAIVFGAMAWTFSRTKIGLLIRAGVQDREMVESFGYRISTLFVIVFVAGSALAGFGGLMWGLFQQNITAEMGAQLNILIFIVIIIGGLGSVPGALTGAVLIGLSTNYVGFLFPIASQFANIGVMVLILIWRPQGLFPVASSRGQG